MRTRGARPVISAALVAIILAIILVVSLAPSGMAASEKEGFILWNRDGLDTIGSDLRAGRDMGELKAPVSGVLSSADNLLKAAVPSVVQKRVLPPGATAHDYVSLAIYYWPDPDKPAGQPYVNRDGLVNPERYEEDLYDAKRLETMCSAVRTLALAQYLTGRETYAGKAAQFLRVWFVDPATRMNPRLDFSQGVPGKSYGRPSGIIETVQLIALTDAIRMLRTSESWTASDDAALRGWFADYVSWLLDSSLGKKERSADNNHGVWYDAQLAVFAYFAGQNDLAARAAREVVERRIQQQILPDGRMPRELARTRSLHYTMYNLEAFITLARVGDLVGIDLWDARTTDGRGIKTAIDFVVPFVTGEKAWEHQTIIKERDYGFAPYLAMAGTRYESRDYLRAARVVLGEENGKERLAARTFIGKDR